jgi:DNA-binding beta-propeller fold protein YncE
MLLAGCSGLKLNPRNLDTQTVPLGFKGPISFDDLTYDPDHHHVIIPAGESGALVLINPADMGKQTITGFSQSGDSSVPVVGATSAAIAGEFLFGVDKATQAIKTVDLNTGKILASTPLQSEPDYIRYISATGELWVTEQTSNQIEIFSLSEGNPPVLKPLDDHISVPNGPEGLLFDDTRGLVFTNEPKEGLTAVIQVNTRSVIHEWASGCSQAKGMAVDKSEGYLFVACEEGKLVVMDIDDGFQVTSQNYGANLDAVAFNPKLNHVYLPSAASGIVAIFQLQPPQLTCPNSPGATPEPEQKVSLCLLGTADTAVRSNCVTADEENNIWVCDPNSGQVFKIHDTFPDKSSRP